MNEENMKYVFGSRYSEPLQGVLYQINLLKGENSQYSLLVQHIKRMLSGMCFRTLNKILFQRL